MLLFLEHRVQVTNFYILWKYFNLRIPIFREETRLWILEFMVLRCIPINGNLLFVGNQISWFALPTKTTKIGTPRTIILSQYISSSHVRVSSSPSLPQIPDITHSYMAGNIQPIMIGYFSGYEASMKINLKYNISGKVNNNLR